MIQKTFRSMRPVYRLVTGRNINLAGGHHLGIRHFCRESNGFEASFLARGDEKHHNVLMSQVLGDFRKIRREGNRRSEPEPIELATRFLGNLCEVILAPVHLPKAVTGVTSAWSVDGVHDDAGALRMFDGGIQVRINQVPPSGSTPLVTSTTS